jgi:REP-associated tyrosine transposase
MNHYRILSHTAWDCKYHLIWISKYRKKVLFGDLRKYLGDVFRELALQKESKVLEEHLMGDQVHMFV